MICRPSAQTKTLLGIWNFGIFICKPINIDTHTLNNPAPTKSSLTSPFPFISVQLPSFTLSWPAEFSSPVVALRLSHVSSSEANPSHLTDSADLLLAMFSANGTWWVNWQRAISDRKPPPIEGPLESTNDRPSEGPLTQVHRGPFKIDRVPSQTKWGISQFEKFLSAQRSASAEEAFWRRLHMLHFCNNLSYLGGLARDYLCRSHEGQPYQVAVHQLVPTRFRP